METIGEAPKADNPVKKFINAIAKSHSKLLRLEKWVFWTSLVSSILYLSTGKWLLAGIHLAACAFLLGVPQAEMTAILKDKQLIEELLVELKELHAKLAAQRV